MYRDRAEFKVGQTIGYLTVLEREGYLYTCRCICGKEIKVKPAYLRESISCGCYMRGLIPRKRRPKDHLCTLMYREYKGGAKLRNREFLISKSKFKELLYSPCNYCGLEESMTKKIYTKTGLQEYVSYNGVDRVDNNKGYTDDNCVPCCKFCNQAKHFLSVDDFLRHVRRIVEYQDNIKSSETKCTS